MGDSKVNVIKAVRALTGLGLMEAKDLVDAVPSTILEGVSAEAAASAVAYLEEAGATATATCEGDETGTEDAVEESGAAATEAGDCASYAVQLTVVGDSKVNVIKAVRALTGLGLMQAKDLVDAAPSTILTGVSSEAAATAVSQLEAAGGAAEYSCTE
ncbi:MAG: ribosomal protein L7/L12 [Gemmatimonadota bacterium]